MPYVKCPRCGLPLYSAAAHAFTDTCQRCGAELQQPLSPDGHGQPGASSNFGRPRRTQGTPPSLSDRSAEDNVVSLPDRSAEDTPS
jgi:hypothetical protein